MQERDATAYRLALFCVAAVPLAAGGVRSWVVLPFAIVAGLAAAMTLWSARAEEPARIPSVLMPLFAVAVLNTLLCVPVPAFLARALSPEYEDLRRFVWRGLGEDAPGFAPLALNPAVAALDAVRAWVTLAVVSVFVRRTQRAESTHGVLLAIAGSAILQVVIALVAAPPHDARLLAMSTFVNRNHQAAAFNLAWASALGAYALVRQPWQRAATLLSFAFAVVGVLASLSRAGIAAFAIGAVVFTVLVLRGDAAASFSREQRWVLLLFGGAIVGLGAYAFFGDIQTRLHFRHEEKPRVWAQALSLAAHYPVGTGRGGFGLAFNAQREPDRERGQWDYVENEYLQCLVDYGPVAGCCAVAAGLWVWMQTLRHALRSRALGKSRMRRAAVASACTMIALHSVFDFHWELWGLSLPLWAAVSSLGRSGERPFAVPAFNKRALPWTWVLSVGALASVPLLAFGLRADPLRLSPRELVRTRPLDSWALVQLAHERLRKSDTAGALLWLNRAVLVDRDWAEPHLLLAEIFCRSGNASQGRGEVLAALRRTSGDLARAFSVLDVCVRVPKDALSFAENAQAPWFSALLERWSDNGRDAELLAIAHALQEESLSAPVLRPLLSAARRQKDEALFTALSHEDTPVVWRERAEQQWEAGELNSALHWLKRAAESESSSQNTRERYVELLIRVGELDTAELAVEALARNCPERAGACKPYHMGKARLLAARKKPTQALREYKLILARDPKDLSAARMAAELCKQLGDAQQAKEILDAAK